MFIVDKPAGQKKKIRITHSVSRRTPAIVFCVNLIWHKAFSHIINGHVPVKAMKGESPIKANGKLIVIDGGFCKAYQKPQVLPAIR